jgi:rare lipoprotein A
MRMTLTALMTALMAAFLATGPAAAAAKWTCEGPEYVCGDAPKAVTSSEGSDASERKAKRAAKPAKVRSQDNVDDAPRAKRSRSARNTDTGGGDYSGQASYYWQPQKLASGGWFNPNAMTAAHKTLPFGTRVRVTNQRNGQSVDVVINDRGPYIAGRIIDLSSAAAGAINMKGSGVVPVSVRVLGRG